TISLTGGDGTDTFVLGAATAEVGNVVDPTSAATLAKSLITITDFNKAEDTMKVADGGTSKAAFEFTSGDLGTIAGQSNLLDAATEAIELMTAADKLGVFNFGADAYIVANNDGTAGLAATDILIKVVGVSAADFDASNFVVL